MCRPHGRLSVAAMSRYIFTALTCLLAIGLLPAASQAHANTTAGRIAWMRFSPDFDAAQIVSARADGSDLRVITPWSSGIIDEDPKWSPDSSRILFQRTLPSGQVQIVIIGADGRGERAVHTGCTEPCLSDQSP